MFACDTTNAKTNKQTKPSAHADTFSPTTPSVSSFSLSSTSLFISDSVSTLSATSPSISSKSLPRPTPEKLVPPINIILKNNEKKHDGDNDDDDDDGDDEVCADDATNMIDKQDDDTTIMINKEDDDCTTHWSLETLKKVLERDDALRRLPATIQEMGRINRESPTQDWIDYVHQLQYKIVEDALPVSRIWKTESERRLWIFIGLQKMREAPVRYAELANIPNCWVRYNRACRGTLKTGDLHANAPLFSVNSSTSCVPSAATSAPTDLTHLTTQHRTVFVMAGSGT